MRILLLTDSLGCPRIEVPVEKTWTFKIMKEWCGKSIFYTYCRHGLDSKDIYISINDIKELEPDIILCQVGIVDACRRALTKRERQIISIFPGVFQKAIRTYIEKNHFQMTKKRNIHYNSAKKLKETLEMLSAIAKIRLVWIPIVGGGF